MAGRDIRRGGGRMIYLIGGPPRCGKTTVAKRIAKATDASLIQGDWIEGMVAQYVPLSLKAQLFPKNDMRRKTDQSNDAMYRRFPKGAIINAYMAQAKTSQAAISELIRRAASTGTDMVIEGFQVSPAVMQAASSAHADECEIRAALLVRRDVPQTVRDCRASTMQHDWFLEKTSDPATDVLIAEMIVAYGWEIDPSPPYTAVSVFRMDDGFYEAVNAVIDFMSA